jgi:uncharacterized membrane protein (UPF0182 family)
MFRRFWNHSFRSIVLLLGLALSWDLLSHLVAEILWFQEVGYLAAFLRRLETQFGLWVLVASISAGFLLGNLYLANRLKYPKESPLGIEHSDIAQEIRVGRNRANLPTRIQNSDSITRPQGGGVIHSKLRTENEAVPRPIGTNTGVQLPQKASGTSATLRLRSLLPVVVFLSVLVGLMLLHYGKIALSLWHPNLETRSIASVATATPPIPSSFDLGAIQQLLLQPLLAEILQLGVLTAVVIALVVQPQFWLTAIAVVLSLFWSLLLSGQWGKILQYFYPTTFNAKEPLFGNDISFYIFKFPVWQLLDFWLGGLFLFGLVAVTLVYLLSADSFSEGKFPGFSQSQLRHLYGLGSAVAASVALHYWLSRHELLYSTLGVIYGASYTAINAQLPANTGLSFLAGAIAIFLLLRAIFWFKSRKTSGKTALVILGLYLAMVGLVGMAVPAAVQRFAVQPNELAREQPYIQRSIALTRAAFELESIDVETFNPEGELTNVDLEENDLTIRNIRLWDERPLLETNRQLQQIRLYYNFPDADIDRYTLKADPVASGTEQPTPDSGQRTNAEKQQVLIAARELDYSAVPQQAKTWVNKHLIYTHGFGFTLSPVNTVGPGGLPDYFVKDIGTGADDTSTLTTSSERIRESIPIGKPRIYYGEITNTYVMSSTTTRELDYPSGDENIYNTYDGKGGVRLNSRWRRLLFAQYLKDWQMLLTRNISSESKLLFRRNINQRIRAIAPFLRYDNDPYLVVADASEAKTENYLYWVVDAYTTSDRYPYSDPGKNEFNYIRDSVKVVIDAYNGDVNFYVADPQDPIIKTWSAVFPELFKPLDAMPTALRSHIRYPQDFFSIQSERLLTYHMTDPQVFYNREDQWQVPQEIYGGEPRAVEPYYLIMKLPSADTEEFVLLLPFTPTQRTNLIAWLAARSDGENYGRLLLYQFPKQQLVYGQEQIEALINQDPVISQQISLWNRQGSRALQGNLLVIPIERSLLYVEPLYLEAEQNSLPTLVRVIVVYENRIVMAQTLDQALQAIFQPVQQSAPAIVRPVEEPALP